MKYWLLKTDPEEYGMDHLLTDRSTAWDGVRNPQALGYLAQMAAGDGVLIYHSGKEKAVVGLAAVSGRTRPDPNADDPRTAVVRIKAVRRCPSPVTLQQIRADKRFADFALLRQSRLSVMPVPASMWRPIVKMAGL